MKHSKKPNTELSQSEVIDKLKECPEAQAAAYKVGYWIWATFENKPAKEVRTFLLDLGFHWNRNREAWQHCCGIHRKHAPYDPRDKYVVEPLDAA